MKNKSGRYWVTLKGCHLIEYSFIFGASGVGSKSFFFVFCISSENQKQLKNHYCRVFSVLFSVLKNALDLWLHLSTCHTDRGLTSVSVTLCLMSLFDVMPLWLTAVLHLTCDLLFFCFLLSSPLATVQSHTPSTTNNWFIH
jgi:hypothetical protein